MSRYTSLVSSKQRFWLHDEDVQAVKSVRGMPYMDLITNFAENVIANHKISLFTISVVMAFKPKRVDFMVNNQARLIGATVYSSDNLIVGLGSAICVTTDDFVPKVGKAIALFRALRLPVPNVFTKQVLIKG